MLLSGNKKNLANIIDISINLCPIFGYNKSELLGKSVNYLIPELFHKDHNKILYDFNEKTKTTFYKELFNNDNYNPEYLEKYIFALTKSKFLIYLKLKIYFVQTEGNEFVYIVEVTKIKDFKSITEKEDDDDLKYIVLTDDNFYIQSFTPNCVSQLKLNESYINSNYNIINYIKELKNDYLKRINEVIKVFSLNTVVKKYSSKEIPDNKINHKITLDNISYAEKKKIKKEIVENNYLGENEITWKINLENNNNIKMPNYNLSKHSIIKKKDNTIILMGKNYYEEEFIMEIKKIIIYKELVGYYFIFDSGSKILYDTNNLITMNIYNKKDQRRNSTTKQKKYKYLFDFKPTIIKKKSDNFVDKDIEYKIKRVKSPKRAVKFKSYDKEEFLIIKKKLDENSNTTRNKKIEKNSSKNNIPSLFSTDIYIDDDKDYIIIDDNYVPKSSFNFAFDVLESYYMPLYDIKNGSENLLNKLLQIQATKKINELQKILKMKIGINTENTYDSNEFEDSEKEEKESSFSSFDFY